VQGNGFLLWGRVEVCLQEPGQRARAAQRLAEFALPRQTAHQSPVGSLELAEVKGRALGGKRPAIGRRINCGEYHRHTGFVVQVA
jgi:hypothetical protein